MSWVSLRAVTITMGTSLLRRIVRHSSKPSMPGSMMSINTTSAGCRSNASTAASPDAAPSTVQPSSSNASVTASRMRSSSSTARMRVPIVRPLCQAGTPTRPNPLPPKYLNVRILRRSDVVLRTLRILVPVFGVRDAQAWYEHRRHDRHLRPRRGTTRRGRNLPARRSGRDETMARQPGQAVRDASRRLRRLRRSRIRRDLGAATHDRPARTGQGVVGELTRPPPSFSASTVRRPSEWSSWF